jgi:hypothetical protein
VIEQLDTQPRTTYRGTLSFGEFVTRLKVQMRREHRELRRPDGDVAPRVAFYMADRVLQVQLDPQWFDSRGTKDVLTEQIVKMVKLAPMIGRVTGMGLTPVEYTGLVYGMFRSLADFSNYTEEQMEYLRRNELPPGVPMPRDAPNREEVLSIIAIDREIVEVYHAPIHRHRKRSPRLGPWEDLVAGPRPEWDLPVGLMVDPIREAMR